MKSANFYGVKIFVLKTIDWGSQWSSKTSEIHYRLHICNMVLSIEILVPLWTCEYYYFMAASAVSKTSSYYCFSLSLELPQYFLKKYCVRKKHLLSYLKLDFRTLLIKCLEISALLLSYYSYKKELGYPAAVCS